MLVETTSKQEAQRSALIAEFRPLSGITMRDARPFQAGDYSTAASVPFPPPPHPFFAAAREILGPSIKGKRQLAATAFLLAGDSEVYLPAPADLLLEKDEEDDRDPLCAVAAPHVSMRPNGGAAPTQLLWSRHTDKKLVPAEQRFLTDVTFERYLRGELDGARRPGVLKSNKLFAQDRRTGIRMEDRRAAHGALYTEPVYLLEPGVFFRMALSVPSLEPPEGREIVRLGGEARHAEVTFRPPRRDKTEFFAARLRSQVESLILGAGPGPLRVKLVLLTPAVFSANWQVLMLHSSGKTPAWAPYWLRLFGKWAEPVFDGQKYRMRLIAAAAPKPFEIGFWDSERSTLEDDDRKAVRSAGRGVPKPLYRAVPAGAVYYVELEPAPGSGVGREDALRAFFDDFWLRSLLVRVSAHRRPDGKRQAPRSTYFGKMGFGWTAIGGWSYVE